MSTNRAARAALAAETVSILESGGYTAPNGQTVMVADAAGRCCEETRLYRPGDLQEVLEQAQRIPSLGRTAVIEVRNETTLAGICRLSGESDNSGSNKHAPVAALNFASAKNPGGGFLSGSQAQEESLARSSALYPSLMRAWSYYEEHRQLLSPLYSDAMILSPSCPVFRDDDGVLADRLTLASFISSAAPNAGVIHRDRPEEAPEIEGTLKRRAQGVLALAVATGHRRIVLGAWGCGVFQNDPEMVARVFADLLSGHGWAQRFERISFSVLDRSTALSVYRRFEERLGLSSIQAL